MLGTIILIAMGAFFVMLLVLWSFGERRWLLRPSTRKMIKEAGLSRLFNLLHGYIYLRWTRQYIKLSLSLLPLIAPRIKRWLSHSSHSKILTHEQAKSIININQKIHLQGLEQIIPHSIARDLILSGPPDIAVYECPCRASRPNPCQPTQVCLIIGQPFVDFVLEHHPKTSRRLTQVEAIELLEKEHKRAHLHSAWFKDACLGRFYAICNCCKCCCGGIEAMVKYGIPLFAPSGYIVKVDGMLCKTCKICENVCPFKAIQIKETAVVDWQTCMGCGVCVGQCSNGAIRLVRDERKIMPLQRQLLVKRQGL